MEIAFSVHGTPRPAGSKSAFPVRCRDGRVRVNVSDASGRAGREWRKAVSVAAAAAMKGAGPGSCPVVLRLAFRMPRPRHHYLRDGTLRPDAPVTHSSRPDLTKLVRSVEDAMTGIVWVDDALVFVQTATKRYGDPPGVDVSVETEPVRVAAPTM